MFAPHEQHLKKDHVEEVTTSRRGGTSSFKGPRFVMCIFIFQVKLYSMSFDHSACMK